MVESWDTSITCVTTEENHVAKNTLHVVDSAEKLFSELRVDLGCSERYKCLRADVSVEGEKSGVYMSCNACPKDRIQ